MKNHSQQKFIKRVLRDKGEVSRNFALSNFISRLGAIICSLRKDGWEFDVERRDGDYIYKLKKAPYIPKYIYDQEKNCMVLQAEPPKQTELL